MTLDLAMNFRHQTERYNPRKTKLIGQSLLKLKLATRKTVKREKTKEKPWTGRNICKTHT